MSPGELIFLKKNASVWVGELDGNALGGLREGEPVIVIVPTTRPSPPYDAGWVRALTRLGLGWISFEAFK